MKSADLAVVQAGEGYIHGIWLTNRGRLHPGVKFNMPEWAKEAANTGFGVILWTNKAELLAEEIAFLESHNIQVKDYSECATSQVYLVFLYFFRKGLAGDITAFALASDILRMAILETRPADEMYIYADPNDTKFKNLGQHLTQLWDRFPHCNDMGFAFPITACLAPEMYGYPFLTRNDILIALKSRNPRFFQDYLRAYHINLLNTYQSYKRPSSVGEAQYFSLVISNCTYLSFFKMPMSEDESDIFTTKFVAANGLGYGEYWHNLSSQGYLKFKRRIACADTWLLPAQIQEAKKAGVDLETMQQSLRMPLQAVVSENPTFSDQITWTATEIASEVSNYLRYRFYSPIPPKPPSLSIKDHLEVVAVLNEAPSL